MYNFFSLSWAGLGAAVTSAIELNPVMPKSKRFCFCVWLWTEHLQLLRLFSLICFFRREENGFTDLFLL